MKILKMLINKMELSDLKLKNFNVGFALLNKLNNYNEFVVARFIGPNLCKFIGCIFVAFCALHFTLCTNLTASWQIVRSNIGGCGSDTISNNSGSSSQMPPLVQSKQPSGTISSNNISIRHSLAQSCPVGKTEKDNIRIFSGFLIPIGGINSVQILPDSKEVVKDLTQKFIIRFDSEISSTTLESSVIFIAGYDNKQNKINIPYKVNMQRSPDHSSLEITLNEPLKNNYIYDIEITTRICDINDLPMENAVTGKYQTIALHTIDNIFKSQLDENLICKVPVNALTEEFYMMISTDPLNNPIKDNIGNINLATLKMEDINSRDIIGYYEVRGLNKEDKLIKENEQIQKGFSLILPYSDTTFQNSELSPDYAAGYKALNAFRIGLFALDETKKMWKKMPDVDIDYKNKIVAARVPYFGNYALMRMPKYELTDAFVYPVPYMPNSNMNHKNITFAGLSTDCEIKVYTVSGELVWDYTLKDNWSGEFSWNGKTKNGEDLASGVYMYLLKSPQYKKIGKLMVIK